MVDLSGGPDGPIEHGFSNSVFIVPAIVVVGLTVNRNSARMSDRVNHDFAQEQLDGLGDIPEGVEFPKDFIGADGNFETPSVEDVLKALEGMQGLSIEDRESLKSQLLQQKMRQGSLGDDVSETWGEIAAGSVFASQSIVLFSLLLVIALIFVFFGLKLYRSLTEKERKREEKKKLKMQKKKK